MPKGIPKAKENFEEKAPVASKTTPTEAETQETVEVAVEDLKAILARQDEQAREIEILRTASNKHRLERADEGAGKGPDKRPQGHLKRMNGKIILRWKSRSESEAVRQNQIIYQGEDIIGELVKIHLVALDKDENGNNYEIVTDYRNFSQCVDIVKFRANSVRTIDGETYWLCEFEDSDLANAYGEFEINIKYINP